MATNPPRGGDDGSGDAGVGTDGDPSSDAHAAAHEADLARARAAGLRAPALPAPEHPLGPEALGIARSVPVTADGWTWWSLRAGEGLDGPPGVLQGGLATGLMIDLARLIEPHRAPLHAVTARLEAPTPLGATVVARARPAVEPGWYEVETWSGGRRLVAATVELTGTDALTTVPELVALAQGPAPAPAPSDLYPTCFVCGPASAHPAALRTSPAWVDAQRLSIPWVPSEDLTVDARGGPRVADLVVAAALDCPSAWAVMQAANDAGYPAVLLGTMRLQVAAAVEPLDPVRITAQLDAVAGRRLRARSAVVDMDGQVLALVDAQHVAVRELPILR
jgi:hypothetical protein